MEIQRPRTDKTSLKNKKLETNSGRQCCTGKRQKQRSTKQNRKSKNRH